MTVPCLLRACCFWWGLSAVRVIRGAFLFSRVAYDDPDFESEGLDPEGPSRADLERFGDEFRACPECGADVYDQAEICPRCGYAFEHRSTAPVWVLVVAIFVLITFVLVTVF